MRASISSAFKRLCVVAWRRGEGQGVSGGGDGSGKQKRTRSERGWGGGRGSERGMVAIWAIGHTAAPVKKES